MVAWRAHEDCTSNGEIFEAGSGHYGRILIGGTDGREDFEGTPESVRDHFREIVDSKGFEPRTSHLTRVQRYGPR